jgi:phosphoribosylformylglycinamidine cyclo-ligase
MIQEQGKVSDAEMYEVFNMGTGFIVVIDNMEEFSEVSTTCKKYNIAAKVIGYVEPCNGKEVTIPELNLIGRGQKITKTN